MIMMTAMTVSARVNDSARNLASGRRASGLSAESSRKEPVDDKTFQFAGSTMVIVAAVIATGVIRYEYSSKDWSRRAPKAVRA